MKTEQEIRDHIAGLRRRYAHVLTGERSTVQINAPRALLQVFIETALGELLWVLDEEFKSELHDER